MISFEKYIHEIYRTPEGIALVDVTHTPDAGWEGAYAMFDKDIFEKWWEEYEGSACYDINDIMEYGEDVGAFDDWEVVSNHHRNPEAALKNVIKTLGI